MNKSFLTTLMLGTVAVANVAGFTLKTQHNTNQKVTKVNHTVDQTQPVFYKQLAFTLAQNSFPFAHFYQAKNGFLYACTTNGGLLFSKNNINFQKITTVPSNVIFTTFLQAKNGDIYLGSHTGIFMSQDGIHFKQIFTASVDHLYQSKNGDIYVTSDAITKAAGLYIAKDGVHFVQISTMSFWSTFLQAKNGDIYMQAATGLFMSKDGIHFIHLLKYGVGKLYQASTGTIFACTSFGLFSSTNGTDFQKILNAQVHQFIETKNKGFYAGTYAKGLFHSLDGKTWTQVQSVALNSQIVLIKQMTNHDIYVATYQKGFYVEKNTSSSFIVNDKLSPFIIEENPLGGVLMLGEYFRFYLFNQYQLQGPLNNMPTSDLFVAKKGFYTTELNPQTQNYAVYYWQ